MSGALFYDHRANLAGRNAGDDSDDARPWSARKKLTWLLVCSAASWTIVLAPFLLLA